MRRTSVIFITLTLMLSSTLVRPAKADSWLTPEKKTYYSPNKKFYIEVTPKRPEGQLGFFGDKVEGKRDAGAQKGVKKNVARAALYARGAGESYSKLRDFQLVNEVSPVSAIVSDSGTYVVTFDNWYRVGYGDDVVVIYLADGTLIRKFGLEDLLTPNHVETLPRTVSSIWWGGEHYIDEAKGLLVLKVVSERKDMASAARYQELKIALATGRPLEPKRDLLP